MRTLSKEQRNLLAKVVLDAREAAEVGAQKALHSLGVDEASAPIYLTSEQRELRRKLRAQARQLGDYIDSETGRTNINHLQEKIAYDYWHRMLFARFLAENNLLISPEHQVSVTLEECNDLAQELGMSDGWQVAAHFAAEMLPQIFRVDDPAGQLVFAPEDRAILQHYVISISKEIFLSDDALGWVYQFWQAKRKDEVNRSEDKIGPDELAPVTQLFTEDYMVLFLLHNTLGAWWVAKRKKEGKPEALKGIEFTYLRILEDGMPAAGTFEDWPRDAKNLRILDPCMGSGHFLVFALPIIVAFRMEEEGLARADACDSVLIDNLFGLELDQRCTQIGAFNIAMTIWKMNGYRPLPPMNIACCGQGINASREGWLKLANNDERLLAGMEKLYVLFQQAPVLGSLINPRTVESSQTRTAQRDLFTASLRELQPILDKALEMEKSKNEELMELGVIAQGLAKAAEILTGQYTLVITNVPYLARSKQCEKLRNYCERYYPESKNDLATVFHERCLELCHKGGTSSVVMPQNWLFLTTYKKYREKLLRRYRWQLIGRLGPGAFETISGEVVQAILAIISSKNERDRANALKEVNQTYFISNLDVSELRTVSEKATGLRIEKLKKTRQEDQLKNPDAIVTIDPLSKTTLLGVVGTCYQGTSSADNPRFHFNFWEVDSLIDWELLQGSPDKTGFFRGRELIIKWKALEKSKHGFAIRGYEAWGKRGISLSPMQSMPATIYYGQKYSSSAPTIIPKKDDYLAPIYAFAESGSLANELRKLNSKLSVDNGYINKVPFDLEYWIKIAKEKYPNGLPKPYSSDPTQWVFHGHPAQSDNPLHVTVARLLGYHWPAEKDSKIELSDKAHHWVSESKRLSAYADDDGIVCINSIKSDGSAAELLHTMLAEVYGPEWNAGKIADLLNQTGYSGRSLEDWLRNGFFEQHCQLFNQRPFIWQIWDGCKDGFSVLVNYHKFDKALLEKLTYTYLNDWITRQREGVEKAKEGSDGRLSAALNLKGKLIKIIEGEAPYDIFVRWKPIEAQPLGWEPDLNDGVRINIRPFVEAGVLRKNPNINWKKDRGKDVDSAPWYHLFKGERINDHHLTLEEKKRARAARGGQA